MLVAKGLLERAAWTFANRVLQASNIVVLSPKFLPELNKLPDHVLSMEAAVDEVRTDDYSSRQRGIIFTMTDAQLLGHGDQVHKDRDVRTHHTTHCHWEVDTLAQ
jgi:hypothetical protein